MNKEAKKHFFSPRTVNAYQYRGAKKPQIIKKHNILPIDHKKISGKACCEFKTIVFMTLILIFIIILAILAYIFFIKKNEEDVQETAKDVIENAKEKIGDTAKETIQEAKNTSDKSSDVVYSLSLAFLLFLIIALVYYYYFVKEKK